MNLTDAVVFLKQAWKPAFEVGIFWFAYYVLLKFLKSTGGLQVLRGIVMVFFFFIFIRALRLETITALMSEIVPLSVIGFLVLFQNELRRALTRIGQNPIFKLFLKEEKLVDEIVKSVSALAKKKIGALVAIEKEVSLKQYAESGILVDGEMYRGRLLWSPKHGLHENSVPIA